jgi:hypothetical protein
MTTGSGSNIKVLSQQFERLQCWYYWREGFTECATELGSGGMIYVSSFMMIHSGIQVILRLSLQQLDRLQCCYYWLEGFMKYATEMTSCGMICIPSFMTSYTGVQTILRFCLSNFRGFNVGITGGRDLWIAHWNGLRCHDIHTKFHKDWFRH